MKSLPIRRLLSFALDWVVLALWGGIIFAVVMLSAGGSPAGISNPWKGQLLSFLAMTLPFILYFAYFEWSPWQASLGKRICRLKVTDSSGQRLSFVAGLLRNGLKFIPWELGHAVAHHAAGADPGMAGNWIWGLLALSALGSLWWIAALFFAAETPYNRWVGAQVVLIDSPSAPTTSGCTTAPDRRES